MRKRILKSLLVIVPGILLMLMSLIVRQTSAAERRANCVGLYEWDRETADGTTTLSAWLSFNFRTEFPSVMMKTESGAVEVYIGEEQVYAYPRAYDGSYFVGRTLHFINLPADFGGRRITVKISEENAGFSPDLPAPYFGDYRNLFRLYLQEHLPALLTGVFLTLFGITFLLLTIMFSVRAQDTEPHIVSAILAADLGIWMLGDYMLSILLLPVSTAGIITLTAFYLILPLMLLLLHFLYRSPAWLKAAAPASFAFPALALLLHLTHVFDAARFFLPYCVLLVLFLFVCIYLYIRKHRRDIYTEPGVAMQERGLLALGICLALAILFRNLYLSMGMTAVQLTLILSVIGFNAYVVTLILNYYLHISESYARKKEYAALNQLAYVDVLTGLQNRKSTDNLFRILDSTRSNYCIVSFDLNGLKALNDRYGHEAGDRILKNMADVLNDCFGEYGFRARQGGDEFLVVINRIEPAKLQSLLLRALGAFSMMKPVSYKTDISFSYGYAFRDECKGGTGTDVHALAEKRMYEQKRAYRLSADRS